MRKLFAFGLMALVTSVVFSTISYSFAITSPIANNDSYTLNENTLLDIVAPGVLVNDVGLQGKILHAGLVSNVKNGTLILETNGSFIYVPDANFHGIDSFRYVVNDGSLNSNVADVIITVKQTNHSPVVQNDVYSVNENSTLVIKGRGILSNDTDVDGNNISAILVSNVSNGILDLNSNGTFIYTPNIDFHGTDSFTYKVNDGVSDGNLGTVTIIVNQASQSSSDPILQLIVQIQNILAKITGLENQITTLQEKNTVLENRVSHLEGVMSNIGNTGQILQNNNQTGESEDDNKEQENAKHGNGNGNGNDNENKGHGHDD